MRFARIAILAVGSLSALVLWATQKVPHGIVPNQRRVDGSLTLPNGWKLTPAGRPLALPGDMPTRILISGGKALVVTNGWHDTGLTVVDLASEKVVASQPLASTGPGVALDGKTVWVSGGKNPVQTVTLAESGFDGRPRGVEPNKKVSKRYLGGLDYRDGALYVVDTGRDTVARLSGSPLETAAERPVGKRPYACAISPDGKSLAVSNWGSKSVSMLDPTTLELRATVTVGTHPNDLLFAKDGRLFVANAGSNTVSVILGNEVIETVSVALSPKDRVGATPDALALSPDGSTLYVANADNNCVAVLDVHQPRESRVAGFIPTGWYPSSLAVTPDGKRLIVGIGKGLMFRPNYPPQSAQHTTDANAPREYDYIGGVLSGWLSFIDIGGAKQLAAYTAQVRKNLPALADNGLRPSDVESVRRDALSKIKHVVYVIRENRTYDQVFGDIAEGNGDPNLVFFGEDVTPNAHRLAREFVLLDNLYCNGEVSQDGHQWCNAAYATMFTERAYLSNYSGRSQPADDDSVTASPAGYLWDSCRRHGLSYISYGEFAQFTSSPDAPPKFRGAATLEGHARQGWKGRDYEKADLFIEDLKKAEQTGEWPNYMVMSLGEDHTSGLRAGAHTPQASVASNDLAIGKIVEALSHSRFWKDSAVFIIEDDAQNGPDHVDAHRTVGLVISPYTRRHFVDSTLYTTSSFIRTMELILGLPPMTQYDEHASPLARCFSARFDETPYTALPAKVDLQQKNAPKGALQTLSAQLDWTGYDRADPDKLNRILWAALKPGRPMPAPVRSAYAAP